MKPVVILANNVEELGGAQVVVHSLAEIFRINGHDCTLVGVTPFAQPHDFGDAETIALMPRIWPLAVAGDEANAKIRAQLRASAVNNLVVLLEAREPGFVIAAQLWSLEILLDAMKQVHRQAEWRIVGQYHGAFSAAARGRDLKRALRLAPSCDEFAVLTHEDAQAFADCGLTNMIVMGNPSTWSPSPGFARAPGKFIDFIGRFSHEKGPDLALAGFELARRELGSEWTLRMVGSGPMDAELREQAGPQVEFVAPLANIDPILKQSAALLLTSRTEGAPLVVAEALAAGVPVIATDCSSGIREFFSAADSVYTGLIPRESASDVAAALLRFAKSLPAEISQPQPRVDLTYQRWSDLFTSLQV